MNNLDYLQSQMTIDDWREIYTERFFSVYDNLNIRERNNYVLSCIKYHFKNKNYED